MKPTLVLIGRPNVGKSTLFNRLTRSRDALVADLPGLTRDRHYGHGALGDKPYLVVDTGGFEPVAKDGILHHMARQTQQAIDEADKVVFLVDARQGLTPMDKAIAATVRQSGRQAMVVVNKAEGMARAIVAAEFFELGLGEPVAISAAHGDGVRELVELALADFPREEEPPADGGKQPKIAVVGRPNVGKSTLVNSLLGEDRVIAFDQAGTTRDSIYVDFERGGQHYVLIDTAGVRKRGKVFEAVEKFSVVKTLQAIEDANVVVLLVDAQQDISDQDASLAGFVLESGRALVLAVNKWDGLDTDRRNRIKGDIARRLNFLGFARCHYISALTGSGVRLLMKSVNEAYAAAMVKMPTPKLSRTLQEAVAKQPPPVSGLRRPKLRYAHQGGSNPPIIVVHGTSVDGVGDSYRRYLEKVFREAFKLSGTPLRVQFKQAHNPYAGKKAAPLTKGEANRARRERRFRKRAFG